MRLTRAEIDDFFEAIIALNLLVWVVLVVYEIVKLNVLILLSLVLR